MFVLVFAPPSPAVMRTWANCDSSSWSSGPWMYSLYSSLKVWHTQCVWISAHSGNTQLQDTKGTFASLRPILHACFPTSLYFLERLLVVPQLRDLMQEALQPLELTALCSGRGRGVIAGSGSMKDPYKLHQEGNIGKVARTTTSMQMPTLKTVRGFRHQAYSP